MRTAGNERTKERNDENAFSPARRPFGFEEERRLTRESVKLSTKVLLPEVVVQFWIESVQALVEELSDEATKNETDQTRRRSVSKSEKEEEERSQRKGRERLTARPSCTPFSVGET